MYKSKAVDTSPPTDMTLFAHTTWSLKVEVMVKLGAQMPPTQEQSKKLF